MKTTPSLLFAAACALSLSCEQSKTTPGGSASNTQQARSNGKIEFIEFHADWCGPCRQQKPIVEGLKPRYKQVTFRVLDVDEDANAALAAKYKVESIPRMIILVNGKVEGDFLGLQSEQQLIQGLDKAIAAANKLRSP